MEIAGYLLSGMCRTNNLEQFSEGPTRDKRNLVSGSSDMSHLRSEELSTEVTRSMGVHLKIRRGQDVLGLTECIRGNTLVSSVNYFNSEASEALARTCKLGSRGQSKKAKIAQLATYVNPQA